jgi:hypothetical protein
LRLGGGPGGKRYPAHVLTPGFTLISATRCEVL